MGTMKTQLISILILSIISASTAVRCYQCYNQAIMGYPTFGVATNDCGSDLTVGSSIGSANGNYCMRVHYNDNGNIRVVRMAAEVCIESDGQGLNIHCCTTDDCNRNFPG